MKKMKKHLSDCHHRPASRPHRSERASQLKIIAAVAEATAQRPHSGAARLLVINQGGDFVAFLRSSVEDVQFRNDSIEYGCDMISG
jgi:hypothetical protein